MRRLEERGLVHRGRSREDKRIVMVGITRDGEEHLVPALRTYSALVRRFALGDSTRRVSDALKAREVFSDP